MLEEVARDVNESRRRWEIVKAVLEGYGFGPPSLRIPPPPAPPPPSGTINGKVSSFAKSFGSRTGGGKRPQSAGAGTSSPNPFGARRAGSAPPVDDVVPNPLSRIQSLKTKLKTSFSPLVNSVYSCHYSVGSCFSHQIDAIFSWGCRRGPRRSCRVSRLTLDLSLSILTPITDSWHGKPDLNNVKQPSETSSEYWWLNGLGVSVALLPLSGGGGCASGM